MKKSVIIILTICLCAISINTNAQSKNLTDKFTVQVDGLGCPFCAYGLEKKFKELKGIKKVTIEMATGTMDFEYPSDKQLTIGKVENQVEKAGYTPVSVAVTRANGKTEKSEATKTEDLVTGSTKSISFFVAGNCDMCKARIEKAATGVKGVKNATWNKETKQLSVNAATSVPQSDIEEAVAKVGHDTKNKKASDKTYKALPGCCHYDRVQ